MTAPAPPRTPPSLRHVALPVALSLAALAAWLLWPRTLPPEPPLPRPTAPSAVPALPSSSPPPTSPSRPTPPPPSAVEDVPAAAPLALASDASAPRVVLRGPWGDGPGQFGRRAASEGSPEAPNSLSIDASGDVAVLDQVNRRVQRFRDGRFVGSLPLPNEAAQDLATASDGRVAVLDRLGDPSLTLFDAAGRPARTVPLVGGPISEGGAVTGLFAASDGLYVEREHRELVRLTDARGEPDPSRTTLWGRPGRDGATLLRAAIADRPRGMVTVSAAARATGAMDWSRTVTLDGAILHLVLLDGDRHGRVYLGAVAGRELGGAITDPRTLVVRFDRAGVPVATLRLPAPPEADELFRPLAIDDEGHVFALSPGADGLSLVEYTFPD
ncbi:MAG: hypothetical protein IPN17_20505 [Deltaproteobacteria bacterium]|nr:hypothetical protein [Deltaproteobacteria bacterium]